MRDSGIASLGDSAQAQFIAQQALQNYVQWDNSRDDQGSDTERLITEVGMKQIIHNSSPAAQKAFSISRVDGAMLLGLILVGAATSVMLSNTQSFKATQRLHQHSGARLGLN